MHSRPRPPDDCRLNGLVEEPFVAAVTIAYSHSAPSFLFAMARYPLAQQVADWYSPTALLSSAAAARGMRDGARPGFWQLFGDRNLACSQPPDVYIGEVGQRLHSA